MYEVELRALVKDFYEIKTKLDNFAKPIQQEIREVTIFFINPAKPDFDLRLRLQKGAYFLNFKERLSKTARKEIESCISDPKAVYDILLEAGFKINMIVARIKYTYKYENYDILLNRVLNWGDAIEVESNITYESEAEKVEKNIEEFIKSSLKLDKLLTKEEMLKMNEEYCKKINFEAIKIQDVIDYINGVKDGNFLSN